MNLLIMGPAGSGKGTFSERIIEHYGIKHISTGDMLREHVKSQTELGKLAAGYMNAGKLVPNDVVNQMVEYTLSQDDCKAGWLLDGYPRTLEQAYELEKITERIGRPIDTVIVLEVGLETLQDRITTRRVCPQCGAIYNIKSHPSKVPGICDQCGHELIQRKDDTLEELEVRMTEYHQNTEPVIDFYEAKGLVHRIDGDRAREEIFGDIQEILDRIG